MDGLIIYIGFILMFTGVLYVFFSFKNKKDSSEINTYIEFNKESVTNTTRKAYQEFLNSDTVNLRFNH